MAQPPNMADLQAALNGMTVDRNLLAQTIQTYNSHQQQFTNELTRCANYPVGQIQQQLAQIQQTLQLSMAVNNAQFRNLYAKIENAKVVRATGALVPMLSIDSGNNPQVPVGQPIPNFPGTPNDIYQLNAGLFLQVNLG